MKNKLKYISILLFGICSLFMIGLTDVNAANLVKTESGYYFTMSGGGKPYLSLPYEIYVMDGKNVFCVEPGIVITTNQYLGQEGWINSPYSSEINQKIQLIGYYGYDYANHQTLRYRMATQALIWEVTGGQTIEFYTAQFGYGDYIDVSSEKAEIMRLVNAHYEVPSFNGETLDAVVGQEITLTDDKGILSNFEVFRANNATASINGNTLSITPNNVGNNVISLMRKTYVSDPTTIFVGIDGVSQKMGYFGLNDPIISSVRLNTSGGKVTIEKYDSTTNLLEPLGDADLKGAVYGVYDMDDIKIDELVIDENYRATSDYLPSLSKFYIKEEKASYGYNLDPTKYYFEITADNLNPTVKVFEDVISRDVTFFKVFADGSTNVLVGEPNVEFEFYLKSTNELYTTAISDSNGYLNVKNLPFGTYVVHQKTSTTNYEKIEDFEIVIDVETDEPLYKVISNAEITAKLKVNKIDSESGKPIALSGISFKIFDINKNEYVCQTITYPTATKLCKYETDSNGVLITPNPLGNGKYRLEEVEQKINGYTWNNKTIEFEVGENSELINSEEYGAIIEINFPNKQVKGEIEINKFGEKLVIENGNYYYEEIKLNDVNFYLYADEDIYSQDGTLIYNKNDLVSDFKTKDGYHKITDLFLGKYCLVEISTEESHILNSEKECFSIEYKDQYTQVVSLSFNFKNYLKKGTLEFSKTDLVTGEGIPNTIIEIYTEDDVLVYTGITDELGKITIDNLFPSKFYIIEKEANSLYQITDEKVFFEIKENGEIIKANMKNERIPFDVPKTSLGDSKVINLMVFIGIALGIGFLIYDKKSKK